MINERLKKIIDPVANFWANLAAKTKRIILIALGGIVVIAVVLSLLMNRTQYVVLYPGLGHDEAVEVMTELSSQGVSYRQDNGTIYVPAEKENALRMQLANEGHPKTAPNYDFFTNHVGVMTTDSEEKIIEKYQMNERLEAVIQTLGPIENAYVTISLPDASTYAWDDKSEKASASVTVRLKEGEKLSGTQVSGIKQLVSKSVPNLTADNVAVIDNSTGEELSASSSGSSSGTLQMDLTEFKLKIEQQVEDRVQAKILALLTPTYGKNNVSASVKSQMNLDKRIQDIITYKPTTSDGKGIISQSDEHHEQAANSPSSAGGVAGSQSNTDTNGTTTYPGVTVNGNLITTKDDKSYKYLVSQVEEQIQSDAAALQDMTVSVMLDTSGSMTDQQKQDLTALVANASGVDPSKVKLVVNTITSSAQPANATPAGSATPFPMLLIIIAGAVLLLLGVLAVVLAARRRSRRAEELAVRLGQGEAVDLEGLGPSDEEGELPLEDEEGEYSEEAREEGKPMLPKESILEIRNSKNSQEDQIKEDLQEFATQNPEIAAQLIRSWLRGEDDNHV
jgi:flagellar M-ring protein FliF